MLEAALALCTTHFPTHSLILLRLRLLLAVRSTMMMIQRTPSMNNRTPKRSTSLVSTLIRPVIDRRTYDRSVSPASSFSSSILVRGMSEAMTPQKLSPQSRSSVSQEKSNRRRMIDFTRRRTVAGPTEPISNNKENLPVPTRTSSYRYSATTTSNNNDQVSKKYFFHPTPNRRMEENSPNTYGSTHSRHSISSVYLPAHAPVALPPPPPVQHSSSSGFHSLSKGLRRRSSLHFTPSHPTSPESLDDLLCDREVESYFYPSASTHREHIYINIPTPPNHYQALPYLQGTLC